MIVEVRSFAAGQVEVSVGAESERPDRMARKLLTPILDQDLLGGRPVGADRGQSRQMSADHAAVRRRTGGSRGRDRRCRRRVPIWARSADRARRSSRGRRRDVGREVGIDRDPEQPPVPEVVHLHAQIGDDGRRVRVGQADKLLDESALLDHEHAAVGQEAKSEVGLTRARNTRWLPRIPVAGSSSRGPRGSAAWRPPARRSEPSSRGAKESASTYQPPGGSGSSGTP